MPSTKGHVSRARIGAKSKDGPCKKPQHSNKEKVSPKPSLFSIESPHFLRTIGPKQIEVLSKFIPSAVVYGITSAMLVCYITEWKTVLQYVPYYGGKYSK